MQRKREGGRERPTKKEEKGQRIESYRKWQRTGIESEPKSLICEV